MKEISLKFPYLEEPNKDGITFDETTSGLLDYIINSDNNVTIPVTWYSSIEEYQYAIKNTLRYITIDLMFKVGQVVSYDSQTGMITIHVNDNVPEKIQNMGKIVPRAFVKKLEPSTKLMNLEKLIAVDIIPKEEITNE